MATFKLEIVTPDRTTYSGEADFVTIPTVEGELGIFPGHMPLMTQVMPGELTCMSQGKETLLAVGEGFVEITPTTVSVLTDLALEADNIDEAVTNAAIARAQEQLKDSQLSSEEMASVSAMLQKSLVQLRVKNRRHK